MTSKPPVINASFAGALRRTYAREMGRALDANIDHALLTGKQDVFVKMLKDGGVLADKSRRPPQPGLPGGFDIVYVDHSRDGGDLHVVLDAVDKRGELIDSQPARLLLHMTHHAVESIYQRLRTTQWTTVVNELKPVASWLGQNIHVVAMEAEGWLLSPNGASPVLRGERFKTKEFDGSFHWVATTWISDEGLEDHTPHKLRVASAVRKARQAGDTFTRE
jgi:hypothetical protein